MRNEDRLGQMAHALEEQRDEIRADLRRAIHTNKELEHKNKASDASLRLAGKVCHQLLVTAAERPDLVDVVQPILDVHPKVLDLFHELQGRGRP